MRENVWHKLKRMLANTKIQSMKNKNKLISFTMEPLELPFPSARNQVNISI
jgi:hypothetical protein